MGFFFYSGGGGYREELTRRPAGECDVAAQVYMPSACASALECDSIRDCQQCTGRSALHVRRRVPHRHDRRR